MIPEHFWIFILIWISVLLFVAKMHRRMHHIIWCILRCILTTNNNTLIRQLYLAKTFYPVFAKVYYKFTQKKSKQRNALLMLTDCHQESRAIAGRTARCRCRCKFRCVSNFTISRSLTERLCMLNTATLSTRTHLAPKPAQNTLNHV